MPDIDASRNVLMILDLCEQIERCNAEIYWHFAKAFSTNPEMVRLWHKTAQEEENHALQFSLAKKLRNLKAIEGATIDMTRAESVLTYTKAVYNECVGKDPSQLYALAAALNLEERLLEFHANSVAVFVDENFKKLFTAMMKADREHFEAIKKVHSRLLANSR